MTIDFARCTATVLKDPKPIALHRNGAGQLLLNLVDFPSKAPSAKGSSGSPPVSQGSSPLAENPSREVEHLRLEDISKEDGDAAIWELLHERFPEKKPHDQMGDALGEVFGLAAKDGESMKEWTARVMETARQPWVFRRKPTVGLPYTVPAFRKNRRPL